MAKGFNTKSALGLITIVVTFLTALLVGGLFINGTSLNLPILNMVPGIVHTIAGWVIIAGASLTLLGNFIKL